MTHRGQTTLWPVTRCYVGSISVHPLVKHSDFKGKLSNLLHAFSQGALLLACASARVSLGNY